MIDIPDSIFPKDADGNMLCPRCQKRVQECSCPSGDIVKKQPKAAPVKPVVRLDKSGRSGKMVTLIKNLPRDEGYLKQLAKTLKVKTGSGGTSYISDEEGVVEIQSDHKHTIEQFFLNNR